MLANTELSHYVVHCERDGRNEVEGVNVVCTDGSTLFGDLLVGADGIRSVVRTQLHKEHEQHSVVQPLSCGYTYYRAVLDVNTLLHTNTNTDTNTTKYTNINDNTNTTKYTNTNTSNRSNTTTTPTTTKHTSTNTNEHTNTNHSLFNHSFEVWGVTHRCNSGGLRFGYVPLKQPNVFWFAAVPLSIANTIQQQQRQQQQQQQQRQQQQQQQEQEQEQEQEQGQQQQQQQQQKQQQQQQLSQTSEVAKRDDVVEGLDGAAGRVPRRTLEEHSEQANCD